MQDAQLQGGNFSFANLNGANMVRAQLQGAQFSLVELEGGYLNGANLRGAHFVNARLAGSYFEDAALQGANLKYANMQGVFLQGAQLQGTNLIGVRLTGAYVDGISIWGALTTGEEVTVLTDWNGAEPEIINIAPDPSDVRRWAANMPSLDDEEKYVRWMLGGKANSARFFSLQADNTRTVKEMVKLASSSGQHWWLSRMTLNMYVGHLTMLRHPIYAQLVTALNSAKSTKKNDP